MSVLARPFSPAAISDWCDLLSETFNLYWFSAVFHTFKSQRRQHPAWGGWLYHHPTLYEPYIRDICRLQQDILDMTDLWPPAGVAVSDPATALHRTPHEPQGTVAARRSIRVLVIRHTGSGRFFPCRIKHRVQISCDCFEICLVLLRISTQIVKEQSVRTSASGCRRDSP